MASEPTFPSPSSSASASSTTHPQLDTSGTSPTTANASATKQEQQKAEALAAFTATLHSVGANLEGPLRERASVIESNAAALERQEAELAEHTARLARQNVQWGGWAHEARDGLKEIGDVQNWAEMIERDLLVLEEAVGEVERTQAGESGAEAVENSNSSMEAEAEDEDEEEDPVVGVNGSDGGDGKKDGNNNGKKGWLNWW